MYQVLSFVNRFNKDQRGAVQVEFIVLTASLIGLCLVVTDAISGSMGGHGATIVERMQARVDAGIAGYE